MPELRYAATLRAFRDGGVDFILVRGLAAVLNGAPVNTFDIDVVHSCDPADIDRLLPVLNALDAVFRMQPERRLKPNASHLASSGHLNLVTRYGLGYEELLPHSIELEIGDGLHVRVLDLETLIAIKEELGREKDREEKRRL